MIAKFAIRLTIAAPAIFVLAIQLACLSAGLSGQTVTPDKIPPLPSNVPSSPVVVEPEIQYLWKPNQSSEYNFRLVAGEGANKQTFTGNARYTPSNSRVKANTEEKSQGSGTGFIVHPQGIIVTCEHVVRGAGKITVRVAETDHEATVIALDRQHDLALLRIDATDLPALAVGDSNLVQLAQEIRVIGFPLSQLLGESIKVTRGEISGIDHAKVDSAFQIDVTVNAGNSGGPMLDQSGRVVGVASQLLTGEGIASVGFAVESKYVTELLLKANIPFANNVGSKAQEATQLVASAAKSVCFIKVQAGTDGGIGYDRPQFLKFEGRLDQARISQSVLYGGDEAESVVVDRAGQILAAESELALPFMLGKVCEIGLEHLPNLPKGSVSDRRIVFFQRTVHKDPLDSLFRLSPRLRPSLRGNPEVEILQGIEEVTGKLGERTGTNIPFTKTYSLEFADPKSKKISMKVKGSGAGVFDVAQGKMLSMEFNANLTTSVGSETNELPLKLTYSKLSDAEVQAKDEQVQKIIKKLEAERIERDKMRIKPDPNSTKLDKFDPDK